MFGYLRLFLAFLVLLSHVGVKFYTLNPGVIAVVIFYILAGYVVSHIYIDIFSHKKNRLFTFYKDRFLRIFPLYIYVIVITVIFLLLTSYADPKFTFLNMLNNLTIIPLNYYMYIDSTVLSEPNWWLIPPAWSLGTELQAYLLLPFALMFKRFKIALALISLIVYILANFSVIHPDYYGYRFVVGVFFIFLLGSAIQSYKKEDKQFIFFISLALIILIPLSIYTGNFSKTYTVETFIGLLIGIPVVLFLSKTNKKLPFNSLFGSFSYALFLTHFLAIWIMKYLHLYSENVYLNILPVTIISILISAIGVLFIEKSVYNHK